MTVSIIEWISAISSAGEHYIDIVGVTGSIPVSRTILRPNGLRMAGHPETREPKFVDYLKFAIGEGCHAVALAKAGCINIKPK